MADTRRSAGSKLTASVTYNIADTYGDAPTVPLEVIEGIRGYRSGYDFTVQPLEPNGSAVELSDDETDVTMIWLWKLHITCQMQAPQSDLDPDEAVEITGLIARDIKTALVLRIPKLGFPGETPRRENMVVTIDGQRVKLDSHRHSDPNSVTLVPDFGNEVTLTELESAASGESPPSRARMMVAEAGFQAFWNPSASHVTAVVVAASACEVAIHTALGTSRMSRPNLS